MRTGKIFSRDKLADFYIGMVNCDSCGKLFFLDGKNNRRLTKVKGNYLFCKKHHDNQVEAFVVIKLLEK